jgi:predicted O-linked N-acetylglucosamine transferase (SPINDLY family)
MRSRLSQAFNQFFDVYEKSDKEIALLARKLEIDIAVDLGGHTQDSRTGIFSYRAAPIQLGYIGYLGTMGAEYFDYLITDETIIPAELQKFYSEKIVCLPSYQVNDRKRAISDRQFTRQELGLPENGFVFCCFNNNYKILPTTFDLWMRILKRVEDSILFLYADNEWSKANLISEARVKGIDGARLVFGERISTQDYLARYRVCDLFLDTFPYNAGTTASDALWTGLPVLTLMGQSFASRVAASLLNAIGLPELITNTQEEYEALAIELATNPQKLVEIKLKLANNRLTTPLFDTPLFTKNLEAAYIKMHERCLAGLPPECIYV